MGSTTGIGPMLALLASTLVAGEVAAGPCPSPGRIAEAADSFRAGLFATFFEEVSSDRDLLCFFRAVGAKAEDRPAFAALGRALSERSAEAEGTRSLELLEAAELAFRRGLDRRGRGAAEEDLIENLLLQITEHDRWHLWGEVDRRAKAKARGEGSAAETARWAEVVASLEALRPRAESYPGERPPRHDGDVKKPTRLSAPQPSPTSRARAAGVEGSVVVQAVIDERGQVTHTRVIRGLPLGLSEAAVEAISQWRFQPASLDGEPVAVYYNLTVNFR